MRHLSFASSLSSRLGLLFLVLALATIPTAAAACAPAPSFASQVHDIHTPASQPVPASPDFDRLGRSAVPVTVLSIGDVLLPVRATSAGNAGATAGADAREHGAVLSGAGAVGARHPLSHETLMNMRAKFQLHTVTPAADGKSEQRHYGAVTVNETFGPEGQSEDNTFARYTPSAELTMTITNPELVGTVQTGQRFYVDFTPAE